MSEDAASTATVKPLKGYNMIAVASGKGGVGKTFFAITLTHVLARAGQKALLFDADLGLANIDIQLGLTPSVDLGQVLEEKSTLKQAAQPFAEGGFDIIAGRSGSANLANLPSQRLSSLRDDLLLLARSYDRVVLDLGAGVDRSVRALASRAGQIVVLTTDEPTALTDAYAFVKAASRGNPGADLRIVVNMARNEREGERTFETLRKACHHFLKVDPPLAGIVRRDDKIAEAIRNQAPLLQRYPTANAAHDIEKVARNLLKSG